MFRHEDEYRMRIAFYDLALSAVVVELGQEDCKVRSISRRVDFIPATVELFVPVALGLAVGVKRIQP